MIEWIEKAKQESGIFVEIGVGIGNTTKLLIKAASEVNKEVVGIDPFNIEDAPKSYTVPYSIDKFYDNIGAPTNFKLIKENSLNKVAFNYLKDKEIALAFIDGLQYYGAVLSDLSLVKQAKIIILDDFNRNTGVSQVPDAVKEFLKHNNHKLIDLDRWAVLIK